jgi:glycosyltransferase involved in cell wall biosynthesis
MALVTPEKRSFCRPKGPKKSSRPHYQPNLWGIICTLFWLAYELITQIPTLYKLRRFYKSYRKTTDLSNPTVALLGDGLDEVNGVALNSRILVKHLRNSGYSAYLIGIAFHNKKARLEDERGAIFMVPRRCSMKQPGYPDSETSVPELRLILRLLRRYPVDLFEIQSPSVVGFIALILSKILGIPILHHYRTDLLKYFDVLVKNPIGKGLLKRWVTYFTRLAGPVIVPSEAFKPKVISMGVSASNIHKLPRGVDLSRFSPERRNLGAWETLIDSYRENIKPPNGIRLTYMGRISKEKKLDQIIEGYPLLKKRFPTCSLTIIGHGPYSTTVQEKLSTYPDVYFTGMLSGEELPNLLADMDILLFPSTTDTFGNSVLEALASGVPCIVSDEGGPQEIVENHKSGLVFTRHSQEEFLNKIITLMEEPSLLSQFRINARERALEFTQERSVQKFWEFYLKTVQTFH